MSGDPYVYPGTSVLRNALDLRDGDRLRAVEADLTGWRIARLAEQRLPGCYDLAHLQAFHLALFEGLYEWAGELRTVAIAKADLFCLPQHLTSYGTEIFARLARANWLRERDPQSFVAGLAELLGDVNALHPFREGNGRAQRAFVSQLARDASYDLHWERIDAQRNIDASIAAMRGDTRPLRALLAETIEPRPPNPNADAAPASTPLPEPELAEVQRLLKASFPSPPGAQPSSTPATARRPRHPHRGPQAEPEH